MTIEEKTGRLQGNKLAYAGDGNNVVHSLLLGCSKMGLDIAVAAPARYQPLPAIIAQARENADRSGSHGNPWPSGIGNRPEPGSAA